MKSATLILSVLGGYLVWRNRFEIQRQLESVGIKTPLLKKNLGEAVHSMTSKLSGKAEHGINAIDNQIQQKAGNF